MVSLLLVWIMSGIGLALLVSLLIVVRAYLFPVPHTRPVELAEWLEYTATRPAGSRSSDVPLPANP